MKESKLKIKHQEYQKYTFGKEKFFANQDGILTKNDVHVPWYVLDVVEKKLTESKKIRKVIRHEIKKIENN